jgi:hypothetical protein
MGGFSRKKWKSSRSWLPYVKESTGGAFYFYRCRFGNSHWIKAGVSSFNPKTGIVVGLLK